MNRALIRGQRVTLLSFHRVRILLPRRPLPKPNHAGILILVIKLPELWENSVAYKSSNLWYFVTAAPTDQESTWSKSGRSELIRLNIWLNFQLLFLMDMNEETVREDVYNNLWHKKRGCMTIGVNVKEWGEKLDSSQNIQALPEPFNYKASRFSFLTLANLGLSFLLPATQNFLTKTLY